MRHVRTGRGGAEPVSIEPGRSVPRTEGRRRRRRRLRPTGERPADRCASLPPRCPDRSAARNAGPAAGALHLPARRRLGTAPPVGRPVRPDAGLRSEEHTSELQSLMRISYAVFCLKKKTLSSQLHLTYTLSSQLITYCHTTITHSNEF